MKTTRRTTTTHALLATAFAALLAGCGNSGDLYSDGGATSATATPAPTSGGSGGSPSPGKELITSTSGEMLPLDCSPKQVVTDGGWASCNLQWLGRIPIPGLTIGGRKVGNMFYLSNWTNGFHAFDTTDPENPKLISKLFIDGAASTVLASYVENEDPATNGKIAVLSRSTLKDAVVIDTSNPAAMKVLAQIPGADAHTHTCLLDCTWSYGSTTGVILDLRDPARPVLLPKKWIDIVGLTKPHDITEVRPGLIVTASDPAMVIDVSDPANPKKLFELPRSEPENIGGRPGPEQAGHIGHDNIWPRQGNDKFFMGLSEGAYQGVCDTFPKDGRSLYLYDTTDWQQKKTFALTSRYTLVRGTADTGTAGGPGLIDSNGNPSGGESGVQGCSVHWFDPHASFNNGGIMAMASFAHGMRLLKVQPDGRMDQIGYFVAKSPNNVTATVDVRWISDRILYVMDFSGGTMDVVKYTGPLPAK